MNECVTGRRHTGLQKPLLARRFAHRQAGEAVEPLPVYGNAEPLQLLLHTAILAGPSVQGDEAGIVPVPAHCGQVGLGWIESKSARGQPFPKRKPPASR